MRSEALVVVALLLASAPAGAQFLDPDRDWTSFDKGQHVLAGAAIGSLVRGPWIADGWRDTALKRIAWAAVIGASYELSQYVEAEQAGTLGSPGYGFSLLDLTADIAGALAAELLVGLGRWVFR